MTQEREEREKQNRGGERARMIEVFKEWGTMSVLVFKRPNDSLYGGQRWVGGNWVRTSKGSSSEHKAKICRCNIDFPGDSNFIMEPHF